MGHRTNKSRGRPLKPATLALREAITELTGRFDRMTVRQCFYQLETAGLVPKSLGGYKRVQRQVLQMRREELLSWDFIADGTRWQRKPATYRDVDSYVELMARSYRRDLWQGQGLRVEVWLEKDALADVITDVTSKWDVPLMVSRGLSSVTFLHSAAMTAHDAYRLAGVSTFVYTLYDHDAGGERASKQIERDLPGHAPDVPIYVERLAVNEEQIEQWNLPTRPPTKEDPQATKWGNRPAVELDAIDPARLTRLVEEAIERHVDRRAWNVQQAVEREERAGLLALTDGRGRESKE
jgi:hypothetical protein